MISNEERREVAENLRNLTIGRSIQYKEQFFDELSEVVVGFEDYHDFDVVLEKLADLIEPQERTDEVPVGEIPGGYIIRKPRKPLFDAMSSQNAFDVLPKVDNIVKYISESVNYEVERKMFKSIAEAYGWKVMDE